MEAGKAQASFENTGRKLDLKNQGQHRKRQHKGRIGQRGPEILLRQSIAHGRAERVKDDEQGEVQVVRIPQCEKEEQVVARHNQHGAVKQS